jgi:nicotinamide mononucleotide transporter
MGVVKLIEVIGVLLNFTFLYFLIKQEKVCWIFGFFGSIASGWVVFQNQFYSESILYLFYAVIAIFGFITWTRAGDNLVVKPLAVFFVGFWIAVGIIFTLIVGKIMDLYTDAFQPYFDAFSSVFGVIATFLEMYKYLIAWVFWFFLNLYTIWLYGLKNLDFLTFQMVIYTVFSVFGYWKWKQILK